MEEDFSGGLNLNQTNTGFIPFQDLKTLFQEPKKFKCVNNNIALLVCSQQKCQLPGFMCGEQDCKCQDLHFKCKPILLKRVTKSIIQKSKQIPEQVKESYKAVYQQINKMIDDLSNLRTKFENEEEYFGLYRQDLQFIQLVRLSKYDKICGKIINQMQNTMEAQTQFSMYTKQQIIKSFKKERQLFQQLYKSIQNKFSKKEKSYFQNKMFLDLELKKLCFFNQVPKQKIQNLKSFNFIPITVNQGSGQFKNGSYKIITINLRNVCERVQYPSTWRQLYSTEQLPLEGRFFFELNIHNSDNNIMIGLLTQQLMQNQTSYNKSINYYTCTGGKYPGNDPKIGRGLKNNKGLMSVLIDMDLKQIHWCIDRQYQGKHAIPQSLLNKKLYASAETHAINSTIQFINSLQRLQ